MSLPGQGGMGAMEFRSFKDYVVMVSSGPPQQDMWLALHPNQKSKPQYYDSILNAGGVSGGVVLAIVIGFCVLAASRRHRQGKEASSSDGPSGWLPLSLYGNSHSAGSAKTNTTGSYASSLPSNLCRHFSFAEIKSATNNFDEALLLGVGGFGKVYKGEIDGGTTKVAIKRGNPLSEQGVHEFQTEIEMLSKLRHRHLVSLIGYCADDEEVPFNAAYKGKKDPDASPGYDGIVADSRSSGISMSIGGRSLASEDSDGLTPSALAITWESASGRAVVGFVDLLTLSDEVFQGPRGMIHQLYSFECQRGRKCHPTPDNSFIVCSHARIGTKKLQENVVGEGKRVQICVCHCFHGVLKILKIFRKWGLL
ncbi:hypothetical protein OIU84_015364 [Salix udensis]|uniref:Tyrosine-protein kinase catalytic domain-containing protein n=1 Tax=Salix udensis TaxID=889485 RepID=A0AAD6JFX9_9ROSI|nr:hypothetical protein OIU84_015364 [Salix udensis]